MNVTTISYRRSATGPVGSLEQQRLAAKEWAAAEGVAFDEEIDECGEGTRLHDGLLGVLARAEGGERIRLVVNGIERIARSIDVWAGFAARAAACKLEVVSTRHGSNTPPILAFMATAVMAVRDMERELRRAGRRG